MNIKPVNRPTGQNRFCGPAAISIVTGMETDEAARLLRHVSGRKAIKGTSSYCMARAFLMCGVRMNHVHIDPREPTKIGNRKESRPTLAQWLKESVSERTSGRVFLVNAGNHWQVISGRRYCCGITRQIVSIKDKRVARRARVRAVYELVADGRVQVPAEARKPKIKTDPYRAELKALERRHGFKGRIERDGPLKDYVVDPCDTFPAGLQTLHYSWGETLNRIETCLDKPELIVNGYYSE